MNRNGFTPWSEVLLEDALRCQRVACFTLGCLEREHRLNVEALMAYWLRASRAWWAVSPFEIEAHTAAAARQAMGQ